MQISFLPSLRRWLPRPIFHVRAEDVWSGL